LLPCSKFSNPQSSSPSGVSTGFYLPKTRRVIFDLLFGSGSVTI
jgi:hypothetical protein